MGSSDKNSEYRNIILISQVGICVTIYFHLPEYAIAKYWNDMSAAAPNTEFVIYNIPQLAGTGLTMSLLKEMLKNPNVIAVKPAPDRRRSCRCRRWC